MTRQDKKIFGIAELMQCILPFLFLFVVSGNSFGQEKYKIAFNVLEDATKDNYDIYSMNMDGSGKKNITQTPGVEWVYKAYEDKIFFISDRDTCHRCFFLYEMDADGNHVKKLSDLQLEDSWMDTRNEGTEMIVLGRIGREVRNQLFLVDLQNGHYRQVSNDTFSTKADPLFLPGGNEIVLRYRPDKKLRRTVPDELWKIELVKAENGVVWLRDKIQLTYFPKEDTSTEWFRYHAGPPQWNSKYKFISYMSRQKDQHQVYAITPDGKKQWRITSGDLSSGYHAWSADGEWMVMDKSTHDEKDYDIYLMNYETGKTIRLTDSPKTEQGPVFVKEKKK